MNRSDFSEVTNNYKIKLQKTINQLSIKEIEELANLLHTSWKTGSQVFIFGNGGSAGNAIHLANDLLYGIGKKNNGIGLKVNALPANSSVVTCLANDEGYDDIFFRQLTVLANPGDVALALSGSGNSKNIIKAIEWCNNNKVKTFAIIGYDGGIVKQIVNNFIHTNINDMQISEDLQLIIGHIIMQWLSDKGI